MDGIFNPEKYAINSGYVVTEVNVYFGSEHGNRKHLSINFATSLLFGF